VEPTHGPGHATFYATNRRNIDRLREQRDRAGLIQTADVLDTSRHFDARRLADEARSAAEWIDETTPRTYDVGEADGIRVGDMLRYSRGGYAREGVVIDTDGRTATTNHGDVVAL
jgi:hypothetical protein